MVVELYYKMNRAMEKAINVLIEAQRECEEDYLRQTDPPVGADKRPAKNSNLP